MASTNPSVSLTSPLPSQRTGSKSGSGKASNGSLLFHQTIIPTQNITHAVEGSFTLPNANDLVVIRHTTLELWTLHTDSGTMECVHSTPLFAIVYAAVAVPTIAVAGSAGGGARHQHDSSAHSVFGPGVLGEQQSVLGSNAAGWRRDFLHYLAITSETGYVTLLRYQLAEPPIPARLSLAETASAAAVNAAAGGSTHLYIATSLRGKFVKVSERCLGRSGARLTVPGARLAVDARGEALFIAALMRNKVVIPLKRFSTTLSATALQLRGDGGEAAKMSNEADLTDAEDRDAHDGGGGSAGQHGVGGGGDKPKKAVPQWEEASKGVFSLGSPIEAHRNTVIFSVCALEGFMDENAVFAALEQEIIEDVEQPKEEPGEPTAAAALPPRSAFLQLPSSVNTAAGGGRVVCRKFLVVYAYVPSLQQVQRSHLVHLPVSAHQLIAVPAAPCGPGGVLVCTDADIIWYDLLSPTSGSGSGNPNPLATGGVFKCAFPLPRRVAFTQTLYDPSVIHHAVARVANDYFLLLQDEQGDLFRVLLSASEVQRAYDALRIATAAAAAANADTATATASGSGALKEHAKPGKAPAVPNPLVVHYFDTIPTASALVLFRQGYLFAAAEAASLHGLYKIIRDGYSKESEYIVKRVRRVLLQQQLGDHTAALNPVKAPGEEKEKAADTPHSAGTGMPSPARQSSKMAMAKDGSMPPPAPMAPLSTGGRVIAVYQPHRHLRHMGLVQSYTNTPAITGFASFIPDRRGGKTTNEESEDENDQNDGGRHKKSAQQQQQVQITGVAGRGSDSVLFTTRYGYTTKREGRFLLPASFQGIIVLPSATVLQQLARSQREQLAQISALLSHGYGASKRSRKTATSRNDGTATGHDQRRRVKIIRQLLALTQQQQQLMSGNGIMAVATDKVVLTTAQGTTVFHVGHKVEMDSWTGFATAERTLAAATLPWGKGYVQVTPRGIYLLPACGTTTPTTAAAHRSADANYANQSNDPNGVLSPPGQTRMIVEPSNWTDPHGKLLLAAAATSSLVLVSFMQGGVASFEVRLPAAPSSSAPLRQCDTLPTFPTAQAVSLLRVRRPHAAGGGKGTDGILSLLSDSSTTAAAASATLGDGALQAMLSHAAVMLSDDSASSSFQEGGGELAAIATVAQEVYILSPRKLREPLEKISCRRSEGNEEKAGGGGNIVCVLLTFLGNSTWSQTSSQRRLFCLIGHMDGTLTRCELEPSTGKLLERVELTCGSAPCQLIAGDGESFCYIQAGPDCWRCDLREGVVKTVPWRFQSRQTAFAPFAFPQKQKLQPREGDAGGVKKEKQSAGGAEEEEETTFVEDAEGNRFLLIDSNDQSGGGGGGGIAARGDEHVIAVHHQELSLFMAQKDGGHGGGNGASIEYSTSSHPLPLEGRRILQHPTRSSYFIVASTEHRSYGMKAVERSRREAAAAASATPSINSGIPLDAPARALGQADHYNSSLQLYVEGNQQHVFPPYYLPEGDAIMSVAVGSFQADFGKEPVVVVGAASQYTHGAGCGGPPSWTQGWLRSFRFTTTAAAPLPGRPGPGSAAPQRPVMMDSEGRPLLRLEPLHNTLIRTNAASAAPGAAEAAKGSGSGAPDYPSAVHICEDVGLLFVGLGPENGLRIYVWGQQQFLRKRQLPNVPSRIIAIETVFFTPPNARGGRAPNYSLPDLYHCPFDRPDAQRRAQEKQLLVVCATVSSSVFVAALQPGSGVEANGIDSTPSFLLVVAQDAVPRCLTSMVVLRDERTIAVADRFGYVVFLRITDDTRTAFAVPMEQMLDAEISTTRHYLSHEQILEEVACHYTGQLVTALQLQAYDPSQGMDPSLAIRILFYGTAMGGVGAYIPFVTEEDAALATYVQPLMLAHLRALLTPGNGSLPYPNRCNAARAIAVMANPTHHVIEGDIMTLYRQSSSSLSSTSVFTTEAKTAIEEEVERSRRMEAARRKVLGLPPRELPLVSDLIAKQRALVTLPQ